MSQKAHWSGSSADLTFACEKNGKRLANRLHRSCDAHRFTVLAELNPDLYCIPCARAARLALAKESAPKPAVVVWPKPRPISEAWDTEILGYCPDIGWRRLSRIGQKWGLTGAEHIADYEPTHFLPLPPKPEVRK